MPRKRTVGLETIEDIRQTRQVLRDVNYLARRFADADRDANRGVIGFKEWARAFLPQAMCAQFPEATLQDWFLAADVDGDQQLTIDEFFTWCLAFSCDKVGVEAVVRVFQRYDPDRSGCLDLFEWQRACEDAGFGCAAHSIFRTLDPDFSGTVDYRELAKVLKAVSGTAGAGKPGVTHTALKQAAALRASLIHTFDKEAAEERARVLALRFERVAWGESAFDVYAQLQQILVDSGGLVADLVGMFDVDADNSCIIDQMEFVSAMRSRFGFGGPLGVLDALFELIDADGSGGIGFDEIFEFVRGKRHSLDRRSKQLHQMTLRPPRGASYALKDIRWDEAVLRLMMQRMLNRFGCGAADLIMLWDKNGDRELAEAEFLANVQALFGGAEKLWRSEVEAVARSAFKRMATSTGGEAQVYGIKLSVTELEVWLRQAPEGELANLTADAPPPWKTAATVAVGAAKLKRSGRRGAGGRRRSSSLSPQQQGQEGQEGREGQGERETISARKREEQRVRIMRHALDYSSKAGRPSTRRVAQMFPRAPRKGRGTQLAEEYADFWAEAQGRFMPPRLPAISPRSSDVFATASDLPRTTAIQPQGSYVGRARVAHGGVGVSLPDSPRRARIPHGVPAGTMSLPDSPRKARVVVRPAFR